MYNGIFSRKRVLPAHLIFRIRESLWVIAHFIFIVSVNYYYSKFLTPYYKVLMKTCPCLPLLCKCLLFIWHRRALLNHQQLFLDLNLVDVLKCLIISLCVSSNCFFFQNFIQTATKELLWHFSYWPPQLGHELPELRDSISFSVSPIFATWWFIFNY